MNIEKLKIAIEGNNIEWRKHVFQRMLERNIDRADVKRVIIEGEIIENYEDDKPFPSALFFKVINNKPLHAVAAFDEKENKAYIITSYEPSLEIFENDYKTRKKK
jgi:Domain of unknown function (DUF4258)